MVVLDKMDLQVFDYETVKKYRTVFNLNHIRHVWSDYDDETFLLKLGALGRSEENKKLCPTGAVLIMFGYEHEILREYPRYFLDYQEHFDETIRWTDRFISSSGEWNGNIYDFYGMAYNKLILNPCFKTPFKMEGIYRVDDTPVRKALREALANCLIHADYYGEGGVVIKNYRDNITIENPGVLRLTVEEAVSGGFSTPRNGVLMKMFNLIDVGERAGSGIPKVWKAWQDEGWGTPKLAEGLEGLERTTLVLPVKKIPIKNADKKTSGRTDLKRQQILDFLKENGAVKSKDLVAVLGVKERRVKYLLQGLVDTGFIIALGANKNRTYTLKDS
jgi:predicted HTH transcriptional regulator